MFIGRKKELEFLEEKYNSSSGEMVVLYGRRRIGKTELLKEFCKNKPHVFYSCKECVDMEQLRNFSQKLLQTGMDAARYINSFFDWEQAFKSILDIPVTNKEKRLVIIDEFPYMCKGNNSIPSILQNLWDNVLKDSSVMLVLCGSSMSFIEKEILSEKNPLYGRDTGIYKMSEMSFYEAIQFFPDYSAEDKIAVYSILGGIPHYLKQFNPALTLADNIQKNILTKGTVLYSEIEFLLHQELRETAVYNSIIEAVALGNTRLSDIYNKTQIEKTKISVYLANLIELGIVKREFSVAENIKETANSQRGLYQITDNYFKFWYSYVYPNYSELEVSDVEGVYQYAILPSLHQFISYGFEDICIQYMRKQNTLNKLPFHYSRIGRWWDKVSVNENGKRVSRVEEIDIMAHDMTKEQLILGECKYRNEKTDIAVLNALKQKYPSGNKKAYYYLFSLSGYTQALMDCSAQSDDVFLIDIENELCVYD